MKRLSFLLIVAAFATVFNFAGAKEKVEPSPLQCDTVIQAKGLTAEQIYGKIKVWFANSMRSSNNVIQLDDINNHHIIGKANIDFEVNNMTWHSLTGTIHFTIDIAARDGRFKLKLYNFTHEAYKDGWTEGIVYVNGGNPSVKGLRKKQNSEMCKRASKLCIERIAEIIVTLQKFINEKSSVVDENW